MRCPMLQLPHLVLQVVQLLLLPLLCLLQPQLLLPVRVAG